MSRPSPPARQPDQIQAVIFDWAGTISDFGCAAPAAVFVEVFRRQGIRITLEQARGPMGVAKREHIEALCAIPAIRGSWQDVHGTAPGEPEIDRMYADFVPLQIEVLARHATLIPGTVALADELRRRGIKIGTCTGYSAAMNRINLDQAERQGFRPDASISSDQVPKGRPSPAMCLMNAVQLAVDRVDACIKVDDTVPGIQEGRNAGMWTIGCAISGNLVGLTEADWLALDAAEQGRRRDRTAHALVIGGAHEVVDSVADLLPALEAIERRLQRGERP